MKSIRLIAAVGCAALLLGMPVSAKTVFYETESGETAQEVMSMDVPKSLDEAVSAVAGTALEVGGKSAVLMELSSGRVLFEKSSHEKLPIASVTKIMTLLLVMEALDDGLIDLQDSVTCSEVAASMGGSQIWLEPGEVMTVHELVKAAAVVSANDACAALAEHVAGSIEEFVQRMNTRAADLSMQDTLFKDCSGLDDTAYSSAHDVALMSRELMKYPLIKSYTTIWMDTLRNGESQLVNTNKLIRFYSGATGLKTGTTSTAGHNLSATAERSGLGFVAVILGCSTTDERFGGARKMLDHGFANYALYTPLVDPDALIPIPVLRGTAETVQTEVEDLTPLLVKKGEERGLTCTVTLAENVEAPVEKGQIVGTVTVSRSGETIAEYPVRAAAEIPRLNFRVCLWRLFLAICA